MCYILGVEKRDIMEKKGNKKKIKLDNNILVILGVFCAALLIVITLFNYYKKAQDVTYFAIQLYKLHLEPFYNN